MATNKSAQATIEDALSLMDQLRPCKDLTQAALKELDKGLQQSVVNALALVETTPSLRRRFMLEDTEETLAQEQLQRDLLLRQSTEDELMVARELAAAYAAS